jgi:hypothetical protein
MSSAQRRAELAARTEKARNMLANNTIVPYGGNIQSETDAVILQQQGYRRVTDPRELMDELENETGRELNLLAYYEDIEPIYELILPDGVGATEAASAADTPDKAVKLAGSIKLDERVRVQLSIAAALVINKILQSVPSHEVVDQGLAFSTKTVIYFEDLVVYIQKKFGDIISLDFDNDYNGDFGSLSDDEVRRFARKLLKKLVTGRVGTLFKNRAQLMVPVKAASVGKVWKSKQTGEMITDDLVENIMNHTQKVLVEGNAGIAFGTKFKIQFPHDDSDAPPAVELGDAAGAGEALAEGEGGGREVPRVARDDASRGRLSGPPRAAPSTIQNYLNNAVNVVLGSVALHVISYALAYAVDAYIRLAIHGADRVDNTITFNANGDSESANVITPQMIYPGIKSALDMYGVHLSEWDNKVAFYLRTNDKVYGIFEYAKKLYDIDTTKPAVKGFMNAKMLDPMWMTSREDKAKLQDLYDKVKGRRNNVDNISDKLRSATPHGDEYGQLAGTIIRSQMLGVSASFGRRRKRRSASFGKKKHGKRRSASFGKKKHGKRRSASFGKKKHGKRRSASFGKKTRRVRK